jgi:hypothetical protein
MRILRLLSSRPLPCGCLAGIYETYDGPTVWILDVRGQGCAAPEHRPGVHLELAGTADLTDMDVRLRSTVRTR